MLPIIVRRVSNCKHPRIYRTPFARNPSISNDSLPVATSEQTRANSNILSSRGCIKGCIRRPNHLVAYNIIIIIFACERKEERKRERERKKDRERERNFVQQFRGIEIRRIVEPKPKIRKYFRRRG